MNEQWCRATKIVMQEKPLLVMEIRCQVERGHQPPHDHYPWIWYDVPNTAFSPSPTKESSK